MRGVKSKGGRKVRREARELGGEIERRGKREERWEGIKR